MREYIPLFIALMNDAMNKNNGLPGSTNGTGIKLF
jgi:hypothetical protein